jgi:hypothetical protein
VLDASPALLTEALCLDVPVVVNHRILGGWRRSWTVWRSFRPPPPAETGGQASAGGSGAGGTGLAARRAGREAGRPAQE